MLSSSQAGMATWWGRASKQAKPNKLDKTTAKTDKTPHHHQQQHPTKQPNPQAESTGKLRDSVRLWLPSCGSSVSAAQAPMRWKQIWRCKHRICDLSETLRAWHGRPAALTDICLQKGILVSVSFLGRRREEFCIWLGREVGGSG